PCGRSPASGTCTRSAAATASRTRGSRCCTNGRFSSPGRAARRHAALWAAPSSPSLLWVRGPFTDRGLEHLRGLDGVFALSLDDARLALTAACLGPLRTLPRLASLAVDAKDDWMPGIAQLPALRFLIAP